MAFRAQTTASWSGPSATVTVPTGVVSGDWGTLVVVSSTTTAIALITPTGWTVVTAQTNFGSGSYAVFKRTGLVATNTFVLDKTETGAAFVAVCTWDSNTDGLGAVGTPTARTSSSTTTTAVAHPTTADYTRSYAVAVGKTSSTLSWDAGTERSEVFYGSGSGHPYASVVEYSGAKATRTATSGTTSGSGLGFQIAILDTPVPPSSVALENSFEGVSDGTAVTTGNSGGASGDAFDAVSGTVVAQTASALNGSRGMLASLAASTDSYVAWDVSGNVHYVRRYFNLPAAPTYNMRLVWGTSGGVEQWAVRATSTGNLVDLTVSGTQRLFLGGGGITPGVLYRVEALLDGDTGQAVGRLYLGHSATVLSTDTYTGVIPAITQVRYGNRASTALTSSNKVDDVAYGNDAWPGAATFTNAAPVVDAGPDQSVEPFSTVTLTGTGTDDSGSVALVWTQLSGTAVIFDPGSGGIRSFTAPAAMLDQTLVFRLTGTDAGSLTDTDDVTITVLAATEAVAVDGVWVPAQFLVHSSEF